MFNRKAMKKQLTAKQYGEKMGYSKQWACQLLNRMYKYKEKAPKVDKVEMIGNRYIVTMK